MQGMPTSRSTSTVWSIKSPPVSGLHAACRAHDIPPAGLPAPQCVALSGLRLPDHWAASRGAAFSDPAHRLEFALFEGELVDALRRIVLLEDDDDVLRPGRLAWLPRGVELLDELALVHADSCCQAREAPTQQLAPDSAVLRQAAPSLRDSRRTAQRLLVQLTKTALQVVVRELGLLRALGGFHPATAQAEPPRRALARGSLTVDPWVPPPTPSVCARAGSAVALKGGSKPTKGQAGREFSVNGAQQGRDTPNDTTRAGGHGGCTNGQHGRYGYWPIG
eukprot:scaffold44848_cov66-Phaeocystis_antarctica.AAC.6